MISCNLTHLQEDSIDGIENTLTKIAYASKEGAGIGLMIDNLRSKKSDVTSFSAKAGGIVRFADMVQSKMRFTSKVLVQVLVRYTYRFGTETSWTS